MRKKIKVTILVLAMMLGIIGTSTVALASESFKHVNASSTWTTIATNTEGFNCNVKITGYLMDLGARIDVRMLGKSGNVLWSEDNSSPGLASRVYYCGPDVYTIQVRVDPGVAGTVFALKTSEPAD